ncbi:MAG: LysR family transcriptional regulator [Flavobacteriales bacterium]|nr:LysR family transcriptional regulator [Flavobacteriales bacterium]MCB9191327.1 LysR family transcriptional regulator [Flavobacteriales bacterium]MCB9204334.1 LysR family transcriptional regulator [Flavobacteriales bacterium]
MTLQQYQYILALDSERNFVRAAEKCFVTQPSLTMQVQKLEDELGVKIFDRSKKPLIPTPIGEKIIAQARVAVMESNRIKELIKESQNELSGELRVGIIPTLAPYLLPLFVAKFESDYPNIRLLVRELQTERIIENLRKDELDLGLLVTPLEESGIKELPLFLEPMLGYVGTEHRLFKKESISLDDLDLQDTWLLSEGHCLRAQVLNICNAHREDDSHSLVFESGSLETLERLVESHKGMTILPYLATLNLSDAQKMLLKPFTSEPPVREVSIVKNRVEVKTAMIQALADTILASIPEELMNISGKVVPI